MSVGQRPTTTDPAINAKKIYCPGLFSLAILIIQKGTHQESRSSLHYCRTRCRILVLRHAPGYSSTRQIVGSLCSPSGRSVRELSLANNDAGATARRTLAHSTNSIGVTRANPPITRLRGVGGLTGGVRRRVARLHSILDTTRCRVLEK